MDSSSIAFIAFKILSWWERHILAICLISALLLAVTSIVSTRLQIIQMEAHEALCNKSCVYTKDSVPCEKDNWSAQTIMEICGQKMKGTNGGK